MSAVVVLEWRFSPPDYFETPIEIARDDYTLTIACGKAEARINSATYDADPSLRQALHAELSGRFLGAQLASHRAYELSVSTITRVHPDGHREIFLEPEPACIRLTAPPIDFQIRDRNGNIVADSKRERIGKKKSLADLIARYRIVDAVVESLLRSHDAAVRDPNNELVHLYEIRDALLVTFHDNKKTLCSTLSISDSDWSRFGKLCNDEPLRQGRHRGRTGGALRDATEPELAEARRIALAMIEAYLLYLNTSAHKDSS